MGLNNKKFKIFAESFKKHTSQLKASLRKQAAGFEKEVRKQASDCVKAQGKYLRPMLVYCCAPSIKPQDAELQKRASSVELIHLASLIHDDVIDNADLRRGEETIFKKFGARTAILLGDAIFAHAMQLALSDGSREISMKAVETVKTLSQGEIMQTLAKDRKTDMQKYLSIIDGKTASLFEFACFLGASLECGSGSEWAAAAQKAGKRLGRAYQMFDDVCDWKISESESGKTAGTDFLSEKQTLPVIVLLGEMPKKESAALSKNLKSRTPDELKQKMRRFGVLEKCVKIFEGEIAEARKAVAKFEGQNAKLLEFCDALSDMMPHS
ncbi:MAG: polyprenyl synthetase family protein [Opitutales bacterium]|nr:polyprenyl synthetase family protein [Opitutales bacterium]